MKIKKQSLIFINLRAASSLALIGATIAVTSLSTQAANSTTTVTQTLSPGLLALTSTPTTIMSGATINGGSAQSSSGSLGLVSVTDSRGSGAGWSLTATTTSFAKIGLPSRISGSVGSLATSGSYTGTASGTYTVTVISGGILGTSTYAVSGLETQAVAVTGSLVSLGTKGLSLNFGSGNYSPGDQWTITVDTIPASNLTLTPSAVTAIIGGTTGVTAGTAHTYSDGSDPATIMTATSSNGLGQYNNTPALSLNIPAGTKSGAYVATITETVN